MHRSLPMAITDDADSSVLCVWWHSLLSRYHSREFYRLQKQQTNNHSERPPIDSTRPSHLRSWQQQQQKQQRLWWCVSTPICHIIAFSLMHLCIFQLSIPLSHYYFFAYHVCHVSHCIGSPRRPAGLSYQWLPTAGIVLLLFFFLQCHRSLAPPMHCLAIWIYWILSVFLKVVTLDRSLRHGHTM